MLTKLHSAYVPRATPGDVRLGKRWRCRCCPPWRCILTTRGRRARAAFDVAIVGVLVAFVYLYIGLSCVTMTDPDDYPRSRIAAGWFVSLAVTVAFLLRLRTAAPPWRRLS